MKFDKPMLTYLSVSVVGKLVKSSIEILSYLLLDSSNYALFVTLLNQAQIATTWILAGFGSAGYKIFSMLSTPRALTRSLSLVSINFATLYALFHLLSSLKYIPDTAFPLLAGFAFSVLTVLALFLRSRDKINSSVIVLEILPYTVIVLFVMLNQFFFRSPLGAIFAYSVLIASALSAISVARWLFKSTSKAPQPASKITLLNVYKSCWPFLIISALNVVLSKLDTTILQAQVDAVALGDYAIASRLAGLTMTVAYIFHHFYTPRLTNAWLTKDCSKLKLELSYFIRDTFFGVLILFSFLWLAIFFNLLEFLGFVIDMKIFVICGLFYMFIAPSSIYTYLLILSGELLFVSIMTVLGAFFTLGLLFSGLFELSSIAVASTFLGGVLLIKMSELMAFHFFLTPEKKCNDQKRIETLCL